MMSVLLDRITHGRHFSHSLKLVPIAQAIFSLPCQERESQLQRGTHVDLASSSFYQIKGDISKNHREEHLLNASYH